MNGDYFP